jgi:hypothetical protein
MNYIQTLVSNKIDFILSARLAIILGIRDIWRRCGTNKPHEPDLVAGLVLESTKILSDSWGEIFKRNERSDTVEQNSKPNQTALHAPRNRKKKKTPDINAKNIFYAALV